MVSIEGSEITLTNTEIKDITKVIRSRLGLDYKIEELY